jgi:asparaginyl-tRNA synthetase
LTARGEIVKSPGAKQPFELKAKEILINGKSAADYPLQKKRHSLEFLRTIAHLRPRTNTFLATFRTRSLISFAIHKFFNERGFIYIHAPIITSADAEGAGEMFTVTTAPLEKLTERYDFKDDFFGKQVRLTVSGQLSAEAFACAFKNVYTFGPTFRAENSNTPRHASEFWMIEPEMAFCDLSGNMDIAEELIKYIISYVLENAPEESKFFNDFIDKGLLERLENVLNNKFERVSYSDAVKILEKNNSKFQYKASWGADLQTEHERYLTEITFKKPVFVVDYPKEIKAFYMRENDDGKTVRAMDCLVPGVGEIIGGSQREERLDVLEKRIAELGMRREDYEWYLALRAYGTVVHSGFGLGLERVVMYVTGMSNIRDVIPFPRTTGSAEF